MALTRPNVAKKTEAAVEVPVAAVETEEQMTLEGVQAVQESTQAAEPEIAQAAAEPVAETKQVAEISGAGTAAPAVQRQANAMAQFSQTMADSGFEGLELTGMSFDRIKLHEGQFKIGSDEEELGQEFDCVLHNSRALYVVRQSTDNDAESFYSYDQKGQTFTDGTSAREKLEDWAEDGYGGEESPLDIREYVECTATLVNRDDEHDQSMVMLSIPPASKARLGGVAAQAYTKMKGALLSDVVVRCQVGKKIGEGQKAFRPWVFKVVGRYEG